MEKKHIAIGAAVIVAIILVSSLLASSLKKLDSDEVAIMYSTFDKTLGDKPYYEGMHTGPPGLTFIVFPSVYKTFSFSDVRCQNIDGAPVAVDVSYQYRVRPKDIKHIIRQFKDHEGYKKIMIAIGRSALHDACSSFNISQFQSERGRFTETVRTGMIARYDSISCDISDLQVQDIRRPQAYEMVVAEKESAREDIELAKEERPRSLTEALTQKRQAGTEADITLRRAKSDARIELTKAISQANSIYNDYYQETETYKKTLLTAGLGLDPEGFLSYLAVRIISEAKQKVYVGIKAPAKTSYVTP